MLYSILKEFCNDQSLFEAFYSFLVTAIFNSNQDVYLY